MARQNGNNNGWFKPGGPGRPRRQVEREYLDALVGAVPLDEWRKVVAKALKQAKAGDARSRDWLGRYLMGSDPILVELSEEVERLKAQYSEREGGI